MADYGGGAALGGWRNRAGPRGRTERRRRIGERVIVVLIDSLVKAQRRQSFTKSRVHLWRVESETQLHAGFEFFEVVVGHALAPPHLALGFATEPGILTVGVRRP